MRLVNLLGMVLVGLGLARGTLGYHVEGLGFDFNCGQWGEIMNRTCTTYQPHYSTYNNNRRRRSIELLLPTHSGHGDQDANSKQHQQLHTTGVLLRPEMAYKVVKSRNRRDFSPVEECCSGTKDCVLDEILGYCDEIRPEYQTQH